MRTERSLTHGVRLIAAASVLFLGCGGRTTLRAQDSGRSEALAQVERALDSGDREAARRELDGWFATHGADADRDDLVRARFLRARLTPSADSARNEYLWVAIEGRSRYGAEAWFRLAQLNLMEGDPERASRDLERLRAEYPDSRLTPDSWYWSGLVRETAGDLEAACDAWSTAVDRAERTGRPALAERSRDAMASCEAGELRLTAQIGAFRDREAAEELRDRATAAGFAARLEREEGLHKVRVGIFGSTQAARAMVDRLAAAGFRAIVLAENVP